MDIENDTPEHAEDLYIGADQDFSFDVLTSSHHDTVFLIDSSASMFTVNEAGETPFFMVLEAVVGYLKDKVVADTKDSIAVILFNSGVTRNHMNFEGLFILRSLEPAMCRKSKPSRSASRHTGASFSPEPGESLLVEALWLSHDVFTRGKPSGLVDRSLYLFQDRGQPQQGLSGCPGPGIQRANDLTEQNIDIELFPFNQKAKRFDYQVMYKRIVAVEDEADYRGFEKLTDLKLAFRRREYRKRTLATIPFQVTPTITLRMKVYLLAKHTSKPAPVKIHSHSNKRLKSFTKFICATTGKELWDHELGTFMDFGKEKVKLSKADSTLIKTFPTRECN